MPESIETSEAFEAAPLTRDNLADSCKTPEVTAQQNTTAATPQEAHTAVCAESQTPIQQMQSRARPPRTPSE